MQRLYNLYQRGYHQEVYDELLSLQEDIYEPDVYEDAVAVAREIMQRVRYNIEQLVVRLKQVGYLFGKGSSLVNTFSETYVAMFQPPNPETPENIAILEQIVGSLPLSLKCWYEEVGSVNFIGLFSENKQKDGPDLDPLYIEPLESLLQIVQNFIKEEIWEYETELIIAPDSYHKYGYSGGGAYSISFPCKHFDTLLINEPHNTTFINYLRICISSGGFSGSELSNLLPQEMLMFLAKDLYSF